MTQQEFHTLLDQIKALSPEQVQYLRRELDSGPVAQQAETELSAFDFLSREGLLGCIEGEPGSPTDLSTNPEHMQGFGRE